MALVVSDAPEDGFGLGGNPGKWHAFYPGKSPADFGLDPGKAVLRWDADQSRGIVLEASLLKDIYSPDNWKKIIYG